ncbi:MAG: bacterioferritin [Oligoflexia bacterium]|nr:bacterioferritin [Oligoflexia bacterium]
MPNSNPPSKRAFLSDIEEIRRRARQHITQGAVTPSYRGDVETAIEILNEALATELVCVLRYKHHYHAASGLQSEAVAQEFAEHARDEELHADQLASRIKQLGGNANFNPQGLLARSHAEYQEGERLVELIVEDLVAERIAIESYREMVKYFTQNEDSTSRRLLEEILAKEEEHADDLANLLVTLDATEKPRKAA